MSKYDKVIQIGYWLHVFNPKIMIIVVEHITNFVVK